MLGYGCLKVEAQALERHRPEALSGPEPIKEHVYTFLRTSLPRPGHRRHNSLLGQLAAGRQLAGYGVFEAMDLVNASTHDECTCTKRGTWYH